MQKGNAPDPPSSQGSERLIDQERQALYERAAAAHAAAAEAVACYAALFEQSRHGPAASEPPRVAIEATREMVRRSVQQYVVSMKALGTPPETTLRLVKETVAAQLTHPERDDATRALSNSVVTWCIQAYYENLPAA